MIQALVAALNVRLRIAYVDGHPPSSSGGGGALVSFVDLGVGGDIFVVRLVDIHRGSTGFGCGRHVAHGGTRRRQRLAGSVDGVDCSHGVSVPVLGML